MDIDGQPSDTRVHEEERMMLLLCCRAIPDQGLEVREQVLPGTSACDLSPDGGVDVSPP